MAPKTSDLENVYTLKISLRHLKPPVWRRLRIAGGFTLLDLHYSIQTAMGWQNCHLFQFEKDGLCYSDPTELDATWGVEISDSSGVLIEDVLHVVKDKMDYTYDFGDSWEHEVLVEKIERVAEAPGHPECLAGKRACPIEDSGGTHGYQRILDILADPEHEEREEILDWVGEELDPERFDLAAVNQGLQGVSKTQAG